MILELSLSIELKTAFIIICSLSSWSLSTYLSLTWFLNLDLSQVIVWWFLSYFETNSLESIGYMYYCTYIVIIIISFFIVWYPRPILWVVHLLWVDLTFWRLLDQLSVLLMRILRELMDDQYVVDYLLPKLYINNKYVWMVYGIHGHTSNDWPILSESSVFVELSTCLQDGLLSSASSGNDSYNSLNIIPTVALHKEFKVFLVPDGSLILVVDPSSACPMIVP